MGKIKGKIPQKKGKSVNNDQDGEEDVARSKDLDDDEDIDVSMAIEADSGDPEAMAHHYRCRLRPWKCTRQADDQLRMSSEVTQE